MHYLHHILISTVCYDVMTSSNGNIFRVTGTGIHRSPVNSPHKGQWRSALTHSLICAPTNGWTNNRDAGDLKCHRLHYYVTVMAIFRIDTSALLCHTMWSCYDNVEYVQYTQKKQPIASPSGRSVSCLLWDRSVVSIVQLKLSFCVLLNMTVVKVVPINHIFSFDV